MAFDKLLRTYLHEKVEGNFFVEKDALRWYNGKPSSIIRFDKRSVPRDLSEFLESIKKYCEYLDDQDTILKETLKIITLEIDYKKYLKFRKLVPRVLWHSGGNSFTKLKESYTKEECRFCFDFVVESAIKIQELNIK